MAKTLCRASIKKGDPDKAKEATKEAIGKMIAEYEALRDSLKSAAARHAKQEKSINLLEQELCNFKINAAIKREATAKLEGGE